MQKQKRTNVNKSIKIINNKTIGVGGGALTTATTSSEFFQVFRQVVTGIDEERQFFFSKRTTINDSVQGWDFKGGWFNKLGARA